MQALEAAQQTPSLTEPKLSLSVSNPEIHVAVDRRRAADLGVRMATIGNTLRLAVAGDDAISFYKEGQEQYPVKIRVLENQRRDAQQIGRLTVPSPSGPVRIDNIARIERGLGPSTLQRSNRQFTVQLTADVAPGHALDEASNDIRKLFAGLNMPPEMTFRLQGQSKILDETTANLIMAIGLAMIFVYMVLASQFESFVQPIVIMLVLPIAVPFALFTLWVTGRTLNLWSALGMLLLLGIVKKNSILQVDYANTLRAAGHAAARGDRRGVPHPPAADSDDDLRDHRRPDPDGARPRHRRHRPRRDRGDGDRRPVAVPVPDAAAGAGGVREVRRARADGAESRLARAARPLQDTAAPRARGRLNAAIAVRRRSVWLQPVRVAAVVSGSAGPCSVVVSGFSRTVV